MQERAASSLLVEFNAAFIGVAIQEISARCESAAAKRKRLIADQARSAANIAQWSTYLPVDCIQSMIRMRWDVST